MPLQNAARNAAISPAPAAAATMPASTHEQGPAGWDPYEVWRTRVLLPRLAEQAINEERADLTAQRLRLIQSP